MKKLVKIAAVAVLSLGFGVAAQAQGDVTNVTNTTMDASAEVLAALELDVVSDINLGRISAVTPGDIFVDPKGVSNANVGTNAAAGVFELTAAATKSIRFGWPLTIDLVNENDPAEILVFTLSVTGNTVDTDQANSEPLSLVSGAVSRSTSGLGKYFLYVGGSIPQLDGSKNTGIYSGSALFTVEYN